jgi:hypothetical protein
MTLLFTPGTPTDAPTHAGVLVPQKLPEPPKGQKAAERRYVIQGNARGYAALRVEPPCFWAGYYRSERSAQLAGSMLDALIYAAKKD